MRSALTLKRKEKIRVAASFLLSCFYWYMLSKPKEKVYVIEMVGTAEKLLFDLAREAAEYVGVSPQHMQRCRNDNKVCGDYRIIGWKDRSYLVGTRMQTFELCWVRGKRFKVVGKNSFIEFGDARVVKDATELCIKGESL